MEGCTEYTNVTGNVTTTIFMKGNEVMAKRVVEIDGKNETELWYNAKNESHRDGDLPAKIFCKDGKIAGQYWYKDGKTHRDNDLPAIIFYKTGMICSQHWFKNDVEQQKPKPVEPIADILARIRKDLAELEARMAKISE